MPIVGHSDSMQRAHRGAHSSGRWKRLRELLPFSRETCQKTRNGGPLPRRLAPAFRMSVTRLYGKHAVADAQEASMRDQKRLQMPYTGLY